MTATAIVRPATRTLPAVRLPRPTLAAWRRARLEIAVAAASLGAVLAAVLS